MLHGLVEHLGPYTLRLTKKALQALIEMCAGNYLNQEAAYKGQAVVSIMYILSHEKQITLAEDEPIIEVR